MIEKVRCLQHNAHGHTGGLCAVRSDVTRRQCQRTVHWGGRHVNSYHSFRSVLSLSHCGPMSTKVKKVRFRSPPPSSPNSSILTPPLTVAASAVAEGITTPGPKPLPIPIPLLKPTLLFSRDLKDAQHDERKRQSQLAEERRKQRAEQKKPEAESRKADKRARKEARRSPFQLEKEQTKAECKARLKAIADRQKEAKAEAKATRKAAQKAAKAGKASTVRQKILELFWGGERRVCDCGRGCGCPCPRLRRTTNGSEIDYTYFPEYQPLRRMSDEYNAWKVGPGPLLTQPLVYDPPGAEAAAKAHGALTGRHVTVHYPNLPNWAEYERTTEPWRRYDGWNGYGWTGDRIGGPRASDMEGRRGRVGQGETPSGENGQTTGSTPAEATVIFSTPDNSGPPKPAATPPAIQSSEKASRKPPPSAVPTEEVKKAVSRDEEKSSVPAENGLEIKGILKAGAT